MSSKFASWENSGNIFHFAWLQNFCLMMIPIIPSRSSRNLYSIHFLYNEYLHLTYADWNVFYHYYFFRWIDINTFWNNWYFKILIMQIILLTKSSLNSPRYFWRGSKCTQKHQCTPPHNIFTVGLACDGLCIIRDACHFECILCHIHTL